MMNRSRVRWRATAPHGSAGRRRHRPLRLQQQHAQGRRHPHEGHPHDVDRSGAHRVEPADQLHLADGTKLTATSVANTLKWLQAMPGVNQGYLKAFTAIDTPDANTVKIKPFRGMETLLSNDRLCNDGFPVSAAGLADPSKTGTQTFGAGAYVIDPANTVAGDHYPGLVHGRSDDPRSSAQRLLAVLDAVGAGRSVTLTEVARRSGLATSTTQRLLREWTEWGGVVRDSEGRYAVAMKLWRLGLRAPGAERLRQVARPYLAELLEATHEHAHLAVLDGLGAVYVERLSGTSRLALRSDLGSRVPLHATAVGQALLAFLPTDSLAEVTSRGLPRYQRNTITDPGRLADRLEHVRREGFARSSEELTAGAFSVAAPIRDAAGDVVAAVSVVGPVVREAEPPFVPSVRMAARGISAGLGWISESDSR